MELKKTTDSVKWDRGSWDSAKGGVGRAGELGE